jgi:hypothetical protein
MGNRDELGHGPLSSELADGNAQHLPARTAVVQALPTGGTLITVNGRIEAHPVGATDAFDILADSLNDTGCFMAHDNRRNPPTRFARVALDIRATDAAGPHPDQDIVITHLGDREITVFERIRFRVNQCFHATPYLEPNMAPIADGI